MRPRNITGTGAALVVSAIAMLAMAGTLGASAASASTGVTVTLSASGTGASATCNSDGTFDLTLGTPSSTTFGEADVNGVAGSAVPAVAPTFTTSNFSTGSPRWVIQLSNGNSVLNNQLSSTVPGQVNSWEFETSAGIQNSSYGDTYSQAVASAENGATNVTVKDAFIVADGDQTAGTTDHITDAQYNNGPVTCVQAAPTPTPSSSKSSSAVPKGGVQTGGGKPTTSLWLPFGIVLAGIATVLAGTAGAVALRRQRG